MGGLDVTWGGDPLCEGFRSLGFHLVVTQAIPAGSGLDKEGVPILFIVGVWHLKEPGV